MPKRILFITQSFPPRPGVAGRRLRFLAERAVENYDEVYAIRLDRDYEDDQVEGVGVFALTALDLRTWFGGANAGGTVSLGKEPIWRRWLRKLRQTYPFLLLTDDGGYLYRRDAYRIGQGLIASKGITTIFSSFRPWSDHLVARKLKRKYPDLHWIADFRDLPVDPVRKDVWWPALQRWWGKRVVATADEMWAVSEGQRAQFEGWHENIKVRRNALLELPPERTAPVTDRFPIVYTGSLYPGLQSVEPLVTALRKMLADGTINPNKLCLIYRGKDVDVFRGWTTELPEACLDVQPSVAPAAAQKMQREAQVLLLLNWSAPGYYGVLTAKLYDYLETGRPILALVNGPGDPELEEIIVGANAGEVFANGEALRLQAWLKHNYETWTKTHSLPWEVKRESLKKYL